MPQDRYYVQNRLLALFELDAPGRVRRKTAIFRHTGKMTDYAAQKGMLPADTPIFREIF